jgi:hypothetical protein
MGQSKCSGSLEILCRAILRLRGASKSSRSRPSIQPQDVADMLKGGREFAQSHLP